MGAAQDSHTPQPDSPAPAPKIDDGGPAFIHGGMTLRDYFAGQAINGLLATEGDAFLVNQTSSGQAIAVRSEAIVETAYALADAMLAARKGGVA